MIRYDAVVLAGGTAARLGGVDKPGLLVGDRSLLDHVLSAVAEAARTVVVGPFRPTGHPVVWCREQPPGGGPVAAVAAALPHTAAPVVLLLAADLPRIAPAIGALRAALDIDDHADSAVLADADGRRNHLAAAWRRPALAAALDALGDPCGQSMRRLAEGATVVAVTDPDGWGADCDTWDELRGHRARAATEGLTR